MDFTRYEKYAIVFVLSEIMKADGVVDLKEQEYLDEIYLKLGITFKDIPTIVDMDILSCKNILKAMSEAKRARANQYFLAMAAADGHVDNCELDIIQKIC